MEAEARPPAPLAVEGEDGILVEHSVTQVSQVASVNAASFATRCFTRVQRSVSAGSDVLR
jgi:hypothetical protein